MEKWNNPELFILGVGNTNEDEDIYMKTHWCHNDEMCAGEPSEHNNSNKTHIWSGQDCLIHNTGNGNGNGESACCCAPKMS